MFVHVQVLLILGVLADAENTFKHHLLRHAGELHRILPAATENKKSLKILQIGDSYSAGNGAQAPDGVVRYASGHPEGCHRSDYNWGSQFKEMVKDLGFHVQYFNFACSGAITDNILSDSEWKSANDGDPEQPSGFGIFGKCDSLPFPEQQFIEYKEVPWGRDTCTTKLRAQLNFVNDSYDIILLTIGGNDLDFADVVANCFGLVQMDYCYQKLIAVENRLVTSDSTKNIKYRIKDTLEKIHRRMRKDAILIYSTYPQLVGKSDSKVMCMNGGWLVEPTGCDEDEKFDAAKRVYKAGQMFESAQQWAVNEVNAASATTWAYLFDDTKQIFEGHEPDPNFFFSDLEMLDDDWIWDICVNCPTHISGRVHIYDVYHPNGPGQREWAKGLFNAFKKLVVEKFSDKDMSLSSNLDLGLVIDTTSSMSDDIDSVKTDLNKLFETLRSNTQSFRVGIVTYQDFPPEGEYPARLDLPFTDDYEVMRKAVDGITVISGGDPLESVFSGIKMALTQLDWRPGVIKVLLTIGDASCKLDPSFDTPTEAVSHISLNELVKISLELDPVQIIPVDGEGLDHDGIMSSIASQTGGKVVSIGESLSNTIQDIVHSSSKQPFAWIGQSYTAKIGETFVLDASGSYDPSGLELVKYEWDINGDGIYDIKSSSPRSFFTYYEEFAGYITLRVTNHDGLSQLATAIVLANEEGTVEEYPSPAECKRDANGVPIISHNGFFIDCSVSGWSNILEKCAAKGSSCKKKKCCDNLYCKVKKFKGRKATYRCTAHCKNLGKSCLNGPCCGNLVCKKKGFNKKGHNIRKCIKGHRSI